MNRNLLLVGGSLVIVACSTRLDLLDSNAGLVQDGPGEVDGSSPSIGDDGTSGDAIDASDAAVSALAPAGRIIAFRAPMEINMARASFAASPVSPGCGLRSVGAGGGQVLDCPALSGDTAVDPEWLPHPAVSAGDLTITTDTNESTDPEPPGGDYFVYGLNLWGSSQIRVRATGGAVPAFDHTFEVDPGNWPRLGHANLQILNGYGTLTAPASDDLVLHSDEELPAGYWVFFYPTDYATHPDAYFEYRYRFPAHDVVIPKELLGTVKGVAGQVQLYRYNPTQSFSAGDYEVTLDLQDSLWMAGASQEELHLTVE